MPVGTKKKDVGGWGLPVTVEGSRIWEKYEGVFDYLNKKPSMTLMGFDYATGHDLALCTFFGASDLGSMERILADIDKAMPHIASIFVRPVIHLRDEEIILPIDAVQKVNRKSMGHLAAHAENWKDIDKGELVPRRLLTRVHEDDYGIYENIVFRDLVDRILAYLRRQIYCLSEALSMLDDSSKVEGFSRLNHPSYYLAIGKLYSGFFRNDDADKSSQMLKRITALYKSLTSYKSRAVYAKNVKAKPIVGAIKKTNILSMHKNYRHIYILHQKMDKNLSHPKDKETAALQSKSQKYYDRFCQALTIFALTNFGLTCPPFGVVYKEGVFGAVLSFGDWTVTVSVKNIEFDHNAIIVKSKHGKKSVSLMLIPMSYYIKRDKRTRYEEIIGSIRVKGIDKYIFLEPNDPGTHTHFDYSIRADMGDKSVEYAILPLVISDINSFRRLQLLVMGAMVASNPGLDMCAFCGDGVVDEGGGKHLCNRCRTAYHSIACLECYESLVATCLDALDKSIDDNEHIRYMPKFYRDEKQQKFRNIIKTDGDGFVCPKCNSTVPIPKGEYI